MAEKQSDERTNEVPKRTLVNKMVLLGDVFVGKTSIAYRLTSSLKSDNELDLSKMSSPICKKALSVKNYILFA